MKKQRIFKWFLTVAMLIAGMLLGGPALRAMADDTATDDSATFLDVYGHAWQGKVPETLPDGSVLNSFEAPEGCADHISLTDIKNITISDATYQEILSGKGPNSVATVKESLMEISAMANGLTAVAGREPDLLSTAKEMSGDTSMNATDIENALGEKLTEYAKSRGHYYVVLPGQTNTYKADITINQLNTSGETSDIAATREATAAYTSAPFILSVKYLAEDNSLINARTGQEITPTIMMDSSLETFPVDMDQGPQTFTSVPHDQLLHATVNYKFADGTEAAPSAKLSGYAGLTTVSAKSPTISGYTPDQKEVAVAFSPAEKTYTVTYKANPTTPPTTESSASSSTADEATTFTPFKIYGKRALYTYKNATFKKNQRVSRFAQKAKAYAPIFEVVGTAKSASGHLRYKLADGTYVTANADYVGKLYWPCIKNYT